MTSSAPMLSSLSWRSWSVATGKGRWMASETPATSEMRGTGMGRMARRVPSAVRTSWVISRYVQ